MNHVVKTKCGNPLFFAMQAFGPVAAHLVEAIRAYREMPPLRGRPVAAWGLDVRLCYVAVAPNNHVFVSANHKDCVYVFTLDGRLVRQWGEQGNAAGKLFGPCGLAVTPSGDEVIVADEHNHRVQVFRPDGKFLRMWGTWGEGHGQLKWPQYVAVTPSGTEVIVSDHSRRVQVFRLSDGAFLRQWGSLGSADGQFRQIAAVCVCSSGVVVVADEDTNSIQTFSPQGVFLHRFGSKGTGPGRFQCVCDVAVRGHELLVADYGDPHVHIFRLDGTLSRVWKSNVRCPNGLSVARTGHILVCNETGKINNAAVNVFE